MNGGRCALAAKALGPTQTISRVLLATMVGHELWPTLPALGLGLVLVGKGKGMLGLGQPYLIELVANSVPAADECLRGGPGLILGPGQREVRVGAHPVRRHV